MMNKIIMLFVFFLFLPSCNGGKTEESMELDEKNGTLSINSEGLEYHLPTNKNRWVMADQESLMHGLLFFGIDTVPAICVGIFKTEESLYKKSSTDNHSKEDVEKLILNVCASDPSQIVVEEDISIEGSFYKGIKATQYLVYKNVLNKENPEDTVAIFYNGYLFEKSDKTYGIVVITGENPNEGNGFNKTRIYLDALDITDEIIQ